MQSPVGVRRVVLVVLDGLRADCIPLFGLPGFSSLTQLGTSTFSARTVKPSITAAAMATLLTGVDPSVHGVVSDRFGVPRARAQKTLLPWLLREHGHPVEAFVRSVAQPYRALGRRVAAQLGARVTFGGVGAEEILDAALPVLTARRRGVQFLHWPDADAAGHRHGWTSTQYATSARGLDAALMRLVDELELLHDPATVLIAFADHGGGGRTSRDHESSHPLDTTIPILMLGGQVARGELLPSTSLLDIPATVLWALGIPQPVCFHGRPLVEAFVQPAPVRTLHVVSGWAA